MPHRHVIGLVFTGPDIEDGEEGHYHLVSNGVKTSIEQDGPNHTHTVGDRKTSGPLPMLGPDDDHDEAKKKKKKKKSRKPRKPGGWGY